MFRWTVIAGGMAALLACSSPDEMEQEIAQVQTATSADAGAAQAPTAAAVNAAPVDFADNETIKNGGREFAYRWPAKVSAIPALAAELASDRDEALTEQKRYWQESLAECPVNTASCRNASFDLTWEVVADLPGYLSLSKSFSSYSGGAHGNYGRGALVWDRAAQAALDPAALFTSPGALDAALGKAACDALNRERAKRRGPDYPSSEDDWSTRCVAIEDTVLFLGSSNGTAFDRIGVYYAPYVAGAYAEGDFEFTLPVTGAILAAVKPEYRAAFAAK